MALMHGYTHYTFPLEAQWNSGMVELTVPLMIGLCTYDDVSIMSQTPPTHMQHVMVGLKSTMLKWLHVQYCTLS